MARKNFRIDFKLQKDVMDTHEVSDGTKTKQYITFKGTLGDEDNQTIITMSLNGSPGNVKTILDGFKVGLIGDIITGKFSMTSKQSSLWDKLKKEKEKEKSEDTFDDEEINHEPLPKKPLPEQIKAFGEADRDDDDDLDDEDYEPDQLPEAPDGTGMVYPQTNDSAS